MADEEFDEEAARQELYKRMLDHDPAAAEDSFAQMQAQILGAMHQMIDGVDRYEYKVVPCGEDVKDLEARLCELGADRWQLARVTPGSAHLLMERKVLAADDDLAALLGGTGAHA